jgi:hypothetical protein
MKTRTYHISNLGSFSPACPSDGQGYITVHDSPRYASASEGQLRDWSENSRYAAIRVAAATEIAERALEEWRKK